MSHLVATEYKCFEDIRRTRSDGSEYWYARELASVLDYAKWENFAKVIKRAMIAKPIGRKWQTVLTSWTKTAADWSCAAISSNGISCLPKLPGMPV